MKKCDWVYLWFAILLIGSLAACTNSGSTESPKTESEPNTTTVIAEQDSKTRDKAKEKTSFNQNTAIIEEYNKNLLEIMLPNMETNYFLLPNTSATYSEEQGFQVSLRLEERMEYHDSYEGLPLHVEIFPYDKTLFNSYVERRFTKEEHKGRKFLIHPDSEKSEVVFVEGGYLYSIKSSTNALEQFYTTDELIDLSFSFDINSTFKDYFLVEVANYIIPSYFMNDEEPNNIIVFYSDTNSQDFLLENQEITLRNDHMGLSQSSNTYWAADSILTEEYGSLDSLTELYVNEVTGYLNPNEPFDFAFEMDGLQFYISPAQEVNQNTGSVSTLEPPNWDKEVLKIFESFFDEVDKEEHDQVTSDSKGDHSDSVSNSNQDDSEIFTIKNNAFLVYGIARGDSTTKVKDIHGNPEYEGTDEAGFYEWIQEYQAKSMYFSFYNDAVDSIHAGANLGELEAAISNHYQGDIYINEEGSKYLYLPETEQLLIYTKQHDDPSKADISVLYADGNFHFGVENGWIEKVKK